MQLSIVMYHHTLDAYRAQRVLYATVNKILYQAHHVYCQIVTLSLRRLRSCVTITHLYCLFIHFELDVIIAISVSDH